MDYLVKNNNRLNKNNLSNLMLYIFVILILLNCQSVYVLGISFIGKLVSIFFQIILISLFLKALLNIKTMKRIMILVFFLSFYIIYILVFGFLEYSFYDKFLPIRTIGSFMDMVMFLVYFLANESSEYHSKINELFTDFVKIVCYLSILSLIFWVLFTLGLKPNMSIHTNWAGGLQGGMTNGFDYIDFMSQGKINSFLFFHSVVRNTGIFIEAPTFAYVLCIALSIHVFLSKSYKVFDHKTCLLLLTIFTTTSSMGIIISLMIISLEYILKNTEKTYKYVIYICLLLLSLVLIKMLLTNKLSIVSSNGTINYNSSYFLRHDDISACIDAWKNHIFIGNGLNNLDSIIQYMNINRYDMGLSTGFFKILALGGILYSLFYILPTIFALRIKHVRWIALFSFVLFTMIVVPDTYIYIMLLSYFWASYLNHVQMVN